VITQPRYLLDTNMLSELAKRPGGRVAQRITELGVGAVATSLVVACEIRFGLAKSGSARLIENVTQVMDCIEIIPLEPPVDEHYADIRNALGRAGTPIGPNDLLIAAHARALNMILVTDNVREFSRVQGLAVENWLE
jgi:tRNA(fMet)-specific endonuclease VapC